nr:unnamed protein product [Spirometra erinaceieuropaei]
MEEFLLREQCCLRSANQSKCSSSQRRRQYPTHREGKYPTTVAEHIKGVLNRLSTISDAAIARPPQVEADVDIYLPPSLHKTIKAMQPLSSRKVPGSDAIPAEIYKQGGPLLMDHLIALFQEMWRQGEVPQNSKDATIVHL